MKWVWSPEKSGPFDHECRSARATKTRVRFNRPSNSIPQYCGRNLQHPVHWNTLPHYHLCSPHSSSRGAVYCEGYPKCMHGWVYWGGVSEVYWGGVSEVYWGGVAEVYWGGVAEVYWGDVSEVYWGGVAEVYWGGLAEVYRGGVTEVYWGGGSEVYWGGVWEVYSGRRNICLLSGETVQLFSVRRVIYLQLNVCCTIEENIWAFMHLKNINNVSPILSCS